MRGLARGAGIAALAAAVAGCTTVRVVQREGCWVRETKKTFRGAQEDVGPCVRPPPKWSEDRLTRLVQECVAQADYRWQVRALAAWNRREPLPPQDSQETVIKTCMNESTTGVVTQNEKLRERLAELSNDREAFRSEATEGNRHLRQSADKVAEYLGEAAKRPPPIATATATSTSDGTTLTENGLESQNGASGALPAGVAPAPPAGPAAPVIPVTAEPAPGKADALPAPAPAPPRAVPEAKGPEKRKDAKAIRKRVLARAAKKAGCEVPPAAQGAKDADVLVCPPAPAPARADGAGAR